MVIDVDEWDASELERVNAPTAGFRQCPVCRSWETTRHVEGFRVWFTCNRCGAVFG